MRGHLFFNHKTRYISIILWMYLVLNVYCVQRQSNIHQEEELFDAETFPMRDALYEFLNGVCHRESETLSLYYTPFGCILNLYSKLKN